MQRGSYMQEIMNLQRYTGVKLKSSMMNSCLTNGHTNDILKVLNDELS